MKKIIIMLISLSLFFVAACQNTPVEQCPLNMINPNSCEFGSYTTIKDGCTITKCRPSADFTCKDMDDGDSYFDKCNTCSCIDGKDACTKKYCPVFKKEGEMCGGIAGFQCEEGLSCEMEGDYPDASGTCIKETTGTKTEPIVDYSCNIDSDCVIKDVGNCCGYYPQCVNKESETDPELVMKLCEEKGISSICGFPEIKSCSCIEGKCIGN